MIQCPDCGSDNQVNAIFCRQCQKKLNLDEINPEDFDDGDEKSKWAAVVRLITVIIVVLLVTVLGLMLIPGSMKGEEPENTATLDSKLGRMQNPVPLAKFKGKRFKFTNDEASYVLMKALGLPREGDAKMLPTKVRISFLAEGEVKLVLQQKAFGKVPFCTTVIAVPTVPNEGTVDLGIKSVSVGLLPMVGPLQEKALKPVADLFEESAQLTGARGNAGKFEIVDNEGTFYFFGAPASEGADEGEGAK
ncbi:MAG: zinc ribbon domain-containing protein [Victivallales bacterium]|nr:zinc ribbon domain-containing protein [Victivallales bacterium]